MKHFKEYEFKEYNKMNKEFLQWFDNVRDLYDNPFFLHCDFEERQGMHGEGRAIDFHIVDGKSLIEQTKKLIEICNKLMMPYRLGVYPHWNSKGFHVDNKEDPLFWILDKNKKYNYYYNKDDLIKNIGVI